MTMRRFRQFGPWASLALVASVLALGTSAVSARDRPDPGSAAVSPGGGVHLMPTVSISQALAARQGPSAQLATGNGIDYHGGPIVSSLKVVSVYWSGSTIFAGGPVPGTKGTGAQDGSLVGYYLRNLAGSSYYNINTTYGDTVGGGHTVANTVSYTGYWGDTHNAPSGSQSVSNTTIINEIVYGFTSGNLTYDPSTIYAVFSANNVNLGGGAFTQYCAYHGYFSWSGNVVLYAVMPYDDHSGCTVLSASPNNDFGADAEVNVLTHEIEETNTDPQLNAWYDSSGQENADKCAWTFGSTFSSNGATANITVGTRNWLVQQQWLNADGGLCVKSYAGSGPTPPGTPTLDSAIPGNGSVALGWTAPASDGGSALTGYVVNRGTTSGGETQLVQLGVQTTYTDTTALNGTTYYYTVQARNAVGPGTASSELSATPSGPPPPPGSIQFVKTIGTASLSKAGNTSLTIGVAASGVAAGHSVIVAVTAGTFGGAVACSDTKGNVYSVDADVTSVGRLFICFAGNVVALTGADRITATYPGFSGVTVATASEFAGIVAIDQKRAATGNSTAPNSGPVTTTHASELIFGAFAHNSTPNLTPGCGMSGISKVVVGSGGGRKTIDPGWQIASATGTYSNCGTLSPSGQWWQAEIVTYY